MGLGRVLDKGHAGSGKETDRLDRIAEQRRVAAHVGSRHPGQSHFLFALGADEAGNDLLALQRDAHGIPAIDQQTHLVRIGPGEITGGIARGEFHGRGAAGLWADGRFGAAAIRRVTMASPRIVVRRASAASRAARVATVVPVAE